MTRLGYFELEEETLTNAAVYSKISMHYIQQVSFIDKNSTFRLEIKSGLLNVNVCVVGGPPVV